jgi:hypothetical protein
MVTQVGTMTAAPVALTVSAADVAKDVTLSAAEPYKGVYVKVTSGPFAIASTSPSEFQGTCPFGDAGTTFSGVEATGGGHTLALGLTFFSTVTYCLPGCFTCTRPLVSQSFSSIAGIVEPDSNAPTNAIFLKLSPTVDGDFMP